MEGFFFFATRQLLPGTQINIATSPDDVIAKILPRVELNVEIKETSMEPASRVAALVEKSGRVDRPFVMDYQRVVTPSAGPLD